MHSSQAGQEASADAFTREVIRNKLLAIASEMGIVLARTSMSPIVYEVLDFACGISVTHWTEIRDKVLGYMMTPIIDVDGDQARGAWYLFQTCTFAEGNTAIWGAARYDEHYRRVDGGWKFFRLNLISSFWTPFDEGWVKRPFVQEA